MPAAADVVGTNTGKQVVSQNCISQDDSPWGHIHRSSFHSRRAPVLPPHIAAYLDLKVFNSKNCRVDPTLNRAVTATEQREDIIQYPVQALVKTPITHPIKETRASTF